MLIPPTTFSKVSDENWEKVFGRVNKYVKKDSDKECENCPTYEERLKRFLKNEKKTS